MNAARNHHVVNALLDRIRRVTTRPHVLMEVCGGQTHSIVKHGLDRLLPEEIEMVHGPGCPVCVTSLEMIDRAHAIARRANGIFCSFGDMLRVPGSDSDLLALKARGADIRTVYSPMDCLRIARENPEKEVVFFAVGFETTVPANPPDGEPLLPPGCDVRSFLTLLPYDSPCGVEAVHEEARNRAGVTRPWTLNGSRLHPTVLVRLAAQVIRRRSERVREHGGLRTGSWTKRTGAASKCFSAGFPTRKRRAPPEGGRVTPGGGWS